MKNYIHYAIYGILLVVSCSQSSLTPEKTKSEGVFGTYKGVRNGYVYGFMNNDIIQDEPQIWEITQGKLDTIYLEYKGPNIETQKTKIKGILKEKAFYFPKTNNCTSGNGCYYEVYGSFFDDKILLYNLSDVPPVTKSRMTFLGIKE